MLTILALLTTAAALSLREPWRRARWQACGEQFAALERHARHEARRTGRFVELVCDAEARRIEFRDTASGAHESPGRVQQLPAQFTIEAFRTPTAAAESGELRIVISPRGTSDSYALQVRRDEQTAEWWIVSGLSGQVTQWEGEADVAGLLTAR